MGIKPQQIERLTQITVAKPLAWALYDAGYHRAGAETR
jgi:hypothetical protein